MNKIQIVPDLKFNFTPFQTTVLRELQKEPGFVKYVALVNTFDGDAPYAKFGDGPPRKPGPVTFVVRLQRDQLLALRVGQKRIIRRAITEAKD